MPRSPSSVRWAWKNVSLMLKPDEINREVLQQQKEKLARFGMTISDAACNELQKNKSIHLNLPDRDFQIRAVQ